MKEYILKVYEGNHPRIDVTEEFVQRNNLTLNRSPQEMLKYSEDHDSMFSFNKEIFLHYMPVTDSVVWIKDEKKQEHLDKPITIIDDIYECAQDMLDYMVFAWMKALDERGISASRSIDKIGCYLWLLGRDDLDHIIRDDSLYNPYGSPALIKVSEALGIEVPADIIEFSNNKCER